MKPVLDTNVLVRGKGSEYEKVFLVQEVLNEVKSSEGKNFLNNIEFSVKKPSKNALNKVSKKSEEINSPTSKTDEKLLALAMSIDGTLVTDDKPLQNLALHLEVDFEGYLDDPTQEKFRWEFICKGCGNSSDPPKCSLCGSQVRRKQLSCS